MALLASKFALGWSVQLVVFSSLGEVSWTAGAASTDSVFAVAPDGRLALSGGGWFQMIGPDGGLLESEQLPAIEQLLGMRFVDDDQLVLVGSLGSALDPRLLATRRLACMSSVVWVGFPLTPIAESRAMDSQPGSATNCS